MPSPLQTLTFSIKPRSSVSGAGSSISLGAIVGIAVGGSIVLFAIFAIPLLRLARWQDSRRGLLAGPASEATERDTSDRKPPRPSRRLQKKPTGGGECSPAVSTQNKHWSLPVLPPLFSRRESLDLGPFSEDGPLTPEQSQRSEKRRGQALSQMRRQSSWIDEDRLHGPRVCKSPKGKKGGRFSWLGGPLRQTLQMKGPLSDTWLFRSPAIPHMEQGIGFANVDEWLRGAHRTPYDAAAALCPVPDHSPMRQYHPAPPPNLKVPVPRPPSAVIHNPRQRNTVVLGAAQQLAGSARLPNPQQPPITKQPAADVELTEILRMTAARLQDGNKSSRRQTMFATTDTSRDAVGVVRFDNAAATDNRTNSEAASPAKSQKSAPAVMMCAELEAIEASPARKQQQEQPPGTQHGRHISQVSHISHVSSVASEPDSLVGSRRVSQPEVQTALSSPSRHTRAKEVLTGAEPRLHSQPISHRSSKSSALSTLYSEDEEPERSQVPSSRHDSLMERCTVIEGLPVDPGTVFPKSLLDGGKDIQSLRVRRGTLGQVGLTRSLRQDTGTAPESKPPMEAVVQCSVYGVDDDPFVVNTSPSRKKARLSQVFSPIPPADNGKRFETATETIPTVRVTKLTQTPTPPSHGQRVFPPPHVLRPMTSSPTLGVRRPSPASSEGDVPAISNGGEKNEATVLHRPATLVTIQSIKISPMKPSQSKSVLGVDKPVRSSAANRSDSIARSQREGSPESTYSQDTLGPLSMNNRDSCQVAMAVAELRRMNSQVSCVSGHSNATAEMGSPTLPALRGGGFSPGKKGGGMRNYLAVGTPSGSPERTSHGSKCAEPFLRRGTKKRRGTVTSTGLRERLEALEQLREVLRDGGGFSPDGGGGEQ